MSSRWKLSSLARSCDALPDLHLPRIAFPSPLSLALTLTLPHSLFMFIFAGYADGKELPPGALLLRACFTRALAALAVDGCSSAVDAGSLRLCAARTRARRFGAGHRPSIFPSPHPLLPPFPPSRAPAVEVASDPSLRKDAK